MISRSRTSSRLLVGSLVFSAITAGLIDSLRADDVAGLDRAVMSASRGRNGNKAGSNPLCDTFNGSTVCTAINQACTTCGLATYADAPAGTGNQIQGLPNGGLCSNVWKGVCPASLICPKTTVQAAMCKKPPAPPSTQP